MIILLYLIVLVGSIFSDENVALEAENAVRELKLVNFQSMTESNLKATRKIVSALKQRSSDQFAISFTDMGGIDEFIQWVNYFDQADSINLNDYYSIKFYAAEMIHILFLGANCAPFADSIISSGLLDKLLPFTFKNPIFSDAAFTSDFFLMGLMTFDLLKLGRIASLFNSVLKKNFGEDLSGLHGRFQSETSSLGKLLLADIYMDRPFVQFRPAELESMSVDKQILLRIRDELLSNLMNSTKVPYNTYNYKMKTSFMDWQIQLFPVRIQRYFNVFLVSESNRNALCDQKTFKYYFTGIILFTIEAAGFQGSKLLCIQSLRGLYILTLACPDFKMYFGPAEMNRKSKG